MGYNLLEANVMVTGIWPLPNGSPPEEMLDIMETHFGDKAFEEWPEPLQRITKNWNQERLELMQGIMSAREAWDELSCDMHNGGKSMFVCAFQHPFYSPGGSYSWSHTQMHLVMADTVDECLSQACDIATAAFTDANK